MPSVSIPGRELYAERRGGGEPLLLIQGLAGHHAMWGEAFLTQLDPGFETIAYDHRGAGLSGPSTGSFSIADLADDAVALLDALGLPSAHVLGISMGGMVAQELALRRPSAVRSLALGGTYAGGPGSAITDRAVFRRYLDAMRSGSVDAALSTSFEINVGERARERPGAFREFRLRALAAPMPRELIIEQARATATHDTSARLGSVSVPTVVIHGDQDLMLDVSNARHIAGLMPHAQLEILAGVGHLFWLEEPARAAAILRENLLAAPVASP